MKQPPKILGFAHGSVVAAIAIYLTLACAPVSEFEDPANGKEFYSDDIDAALGEAATPEGPLENAYQFRDRALITVYVKVYSQIQPQLHVDIAVTYRDNCFVTVFQKVQETGAEDSVTYRFDKPECDDASGPNNGGSQFSQNSLVASKSIKQLRSDAVKLATKGFAPHAEEEEGETAACDQSQAALANSHFYGLSSEKHTMRISNCSQYPGCVTEFTRVQFDQIQNPKDSGDNKKRCHHVYEISVKIPRIIVIYSHCQSYLAKQNDGSILPVTACSEVTDFLAGQKPN